MGYGTFRTGTVYDNSAPVPALVHGAVEGGKKRGFLESFDLSKANVDKVAGTTNVCFRKPKDHVVRGIEVVSSVSLGTSQLSFGVAGNPTKYGAAKAYGTTPNAEIKWRVALTEDDLNVDVETIIMTIGTADLPANGIINVEMDTLAVA